MSDQYILLEKLTKNFRIQKLRHGYNRHYENEGFYFNPFLIKFLIQTKNSSLNILKLSLNSQFKSHFIAEEFIQFLQKSQIYQLQLRFDGDHLLDIPLFYNYLQTSKILHKLDLNDCDFLQLSFNWNLILNALSLNSSIKELKLTSMQLQHFYSDIVNLIINNESIVSLKVSIFEEFGLQYYPLVSIKADFAEAILSNKSLLYLKIDCEAIDIQAEKLLVKSNLKGICLENSQNTSIAAYINKHIPNCYLKWKKSA